MAHKAISLFKYRARAGKRSIIPSSVCLTRPTWLQAASPPFGLHLRQDGESGGAFAVHVQMADEKLGQLQQGVEGGVHQLLRPLADDLGRRPLQLPRRQRKRLLLRRNAVLREGRIEREMV